MRGLLRGPLCAYCWCHEGAGRTISVMAKLVIDLDRLDVSMTDFTEAVAAQIRLVSQVMAAMGIPSHEVRWVVADLKYGSALAAADYQIIGEHAFRADVDEAISVAGAGVRQLATSTTAATRPKHFSDEALKTSRRLFQLIAESNAGQAKLRFGAEEVRPSEHLGANVESLIRGNLQSIGSIEGKLVSVAGQDGSYTIAIQDRLRGRKVRCVIPEAILPRALKAFESRVIVRGIVWSRSDGSAVRIDVRHFEEIPSTDLLPTRQDVRGILRGYERADGE